MPFTPVDVEAMFRAVLTVTPPESCTAEEDGPLRLSVELPNALAADKRSEPPATLTAPAQPVFAAASSRTPLSFLVRLTVLFARVNAVLSLRTFPAVTSIALLAWFSTKVRAVAKDPVARKPTSVVPSTFKVMELADAPKAPSEEAARTPARTSIVAPLPPKVFAALVSSKVPGPDLVRE